MFIFRKDVLVDLNPQTFGQQLNHISQKKAIKDKCKIVLHEDGDLVTETPKVTEIFNNFFTHVADNIGKDFVFDPDSHPSILKI